MEGRRAKRTVHHQALSSCAKAVRKSDSAAREAAVPLVGVGACAVVASVAAADVAVHKVRVGVRFADVVGSGDAGEADERAVGSSERAGAFGTGTRSED